MFRTRIRTRGAHSGRPWGAERPGVLVVLVTVLAVLGGATACSVQAGNSLRQAVPGFTNPVIPGLWTPERMADANASDRSVVDGLGADLGETDPEPAPLPARPERAPYRASAPAVGKVFFDGPDGPSVCSGTAVEDPARPGRSSLVWTAAHCVHGGKGGTWHRNIVFVPSYNDRGLAGGSRRTAEVAPLGTWWADRAATSEEWIAEGASTGGGGSSGDFAVLRVARKDTRASLQQTAGVAVPVWFDAPPTAEIAAMKAWGYPAADPFDGERMFTCQDRPGRLSLRPDRPSLYRIGCTMTGGSSGGGWFARRPDGSSALVSNTSIGPAGSTWLAGPRLGSEARAVYASVSRGDQA
ncbi:MULTISPECIES: serine protease [unclassified Streptomyces]|uniref:trypsin-like serine peptidase n=1 Tax=unclassified Streptomyces TaxID=2593676 RepID=UPI0009A4D33F|nr:trypsin-like peptidase domain-containing protein [Streptomyces sp. 3211]